MRNRVVSVQVLTLVLPVVLGAVACSERMASPTDAGSPPDAGAAAGCPPDGPGDAAVSDAPGVTCQNDTAPCPGSCNDHGFCEVVCPYGDEIRITAGLVVLGNDAEPEPERRWIAPEHLVRISRPFWIDKHEVTVEAYRSCVSAGACSVPVGEDRFCTYYAPSDLAFFWRPLGLEARHPINCVNWENARSFCAWKGARLPTEAEWMRAARGPAEHDGCTPEALASCNRPLYPWGDDPDVFHHANQFGGYPWSGWTTTPVGFFDGMAYGDYQTLDGMAHGDYKTLDGRSHFGVHDLEGNVFEWTTDWFDRMGYGARTGLTVDPRGPDSGTERVMKSTGFLVTNKRSVATRAGVEPRAAWSGGGIRCVRDER